MLFLAAAAALSCATACGDENEDSTGPATDPEELSFTLEATNATQETVRITVLPSQSTPTYLYLIAEKERFDTFASGDALIESDLQQLGIMAEAAGKTREEYLGEVLVKGPVRSRTVEGLKPGTDYVLYAYGLTAAGVATSEVADAPFSTLPIALADCTFDVTESVTRTSIRIDVAPSDKEQPYYYQLLDEERFARLGGGDSPETAAAALLKEQIDYWLALGAASVAEAVGSITLTGDHGYDFTGLESGRVYHLIVFGVDAQGHVCTRTLHRTLTTEAFAPSDNRIALQAGKVTWDSAEIEVTVTNDDPYIVVVKAAVELADKSDDEIIQEIVASYGETIQSRTRRGAYTQVCDKNLTPGTGYEALAFGYDGGATTALVRAPFTTEKENEASDITFTFTLVGSEQVTVTPSDPSLLSHWESIPEDSYQAFGGTPAGICDFVRAMMDAYEISTPAEYLEMMGTRGEVTEDHWIFEGDGDYRFFAIWMNAEGTFAEPAVTDIFHF